MPSAASVISDNVTHLASYQATRFSLTYITLFLQYNICDIEKHMHKIFKTGDLDEHISCYKKYLASGYM